jgi:simple sugar transport system ATP-binding protein
MSSKVVLEVNNVSKRFPGVIANDKVNLKLHQGEILALLGENGAGKSTLMNIIYGLYHPDEGEIRVNGQAAHISSPREAINLGIGMVHQHFQLIPVFTVAENVVLGTEVTRGGGLLDTNQAIKRVRELSEKYGLPIDPNVVVEELSVGMQQRVEIIKTLYREAEILILDEPTAVLTPQEVEELFAVMRGLTDQGKSIIFITHKLKEVMAISDRIVVMRAGQVVGETTPGKATLESLASMMVGREVLLRVPKTEAHPGETVIEVKELSARDNQGHQRVRDISFYVRAGEVLGVAGVQGNGQTELVEVLTGLRKSDKGQIVVNGVDITGARPRRITQQGVAHVPEDRHRYGMVLQYMVADNLVLNNYYLPPYTRGLSLNRKVIWRHAVDLIKKFDIRTPSPETSGGSLSGGNQQKMVVAREIGGQDVKLLIASQPTRGVDVGSIEFIHRHIIAQRDAGVAVLLVSAELDEIMSLSDRIMVMYEGRIVDIVEAAQANREQLGLLMAGSRPVEASSKIKDSVLVADAGAAASR